MFPVRARLAAVILLAGSAPVAAEPRSGLAVGIAQANGNLVPVATFDGSGWSSPWPLDRRLDENLAKGLELPAEWLGGIGSLRDWTLWFENPGPQASNRRRSAEWTAGLSASGTPVVADGLVTSAMGCSSNLALSTDLEDLRSSLIECDSCCPEPKRGIATTGPVPPELVERLEPEAALTRMIVMRLAQTFDLLESRAIERESERQGIVDGQLRHTGQWRDARRRQAIPLRVRRAFRVHEASPTIYYLEIQRSYDHVEREDPGFCPGFSLLKIWVRAGSGPELAAVDGEFLISDCDGKASTSNTPVLYWAHETGIDLLVRRLGWESEYYAIVTISEDTVSERTTVFFRNRE